MDVRIHASMSGSKVHVERMHYTQVQMVCASLDIDRKELNSAAARRATVSLDAASVAKRGFLRVTNYRYRPANCTGGIRRVHRGPTVWPISAHTLE